APRLRKQTGPVSGSTWRNSHFPVSCGTRKRARERKMKQSSGPPRAKKARVLSSTTIYEGPVFGIRRDEAIEPSGVRATREGLTAGEAEPEEDEKIISRAYNRKQLEEMIRGGKLRDAKTVAAILYYFRFLSPQ